MARIRLTVAYQGTRFSGWQVQDNGPTVQQMLEQALEKLCAGPVRVHGSGRTDAGVHAVGQVAHFDVPEGREHIPWRKALNANLSDDVSVVDARLVSDDFHARFSAVSKTYAYTLWTEHEWVLPQRRPFVWNCGSVDFAAMHEAAKVFVGEHDFKGFMNAGAEVKTTVREVLSVSRHEGAHPVEAVYRFTATGFLKQMVRNMVGCLVAVGRGKLAAEDVAGLLTRGDRTEAPATAPARGLTLERVMYPGD